MTETQQTWTVGPAARLAGTTVRALHHYDDVGLVRPSGRTAAGYRVYTEADLDRLREVLVWRELGFGLDAIPALLQGDRARRLDLLVEQVGAVSARIDRLQQVRAALQEEVRAVSAGLRLTQEEKRELFGDDWTAHEDEWAAGSQTRWGDSEAYRESAARTARYTKDDWERVKAEMGAVQERFVALLRAGAAPYGDDAAAVAEEARQVNGRWFYEMSGQMQVELGRMFVDDPRFAAQYEEQAAGLAAFVSAAYQSHGARVQAAGG